MYRKKIDAWGWRKDFTSDEVLAILYSQSSQAEASGPIPHPVPQVEAISET
jgi:hypothetical protein